MKKTILTFTLLASTSFVASAAVFNDFTVDETPFRPQIEGTNYLIEADKFSGGYDEVLTTEEGGAFYSSAVGHLTSLFRNDGADPVNESVLGLDLSTPDGDYGYSLYAIFTASGQQDVLGGGVFGESAAFELWLDAESDTETSLSNESTGALSDISKTAGTIDDRLLASAFTTSRNVGIPGTPGAFDIVFSDFDLTLDGKAYFVAPDPFWMNVNINGDFDSFEFNPGTQFFTGDMSAVFVSDIPEPATLAAFGIGLISLAGMVRRRKE